jgi:hypothetical protein
MVPGRNIQIEVIIQIIIQIDNFEVIKKHKSGMRRRKLPVAQKERGDKKREHFFWREMESNRRKEYRKD